MSPQRLPGAPHYFKTHHTGSLTPPEGLTIYGRSVPIEDEYFAEETEYFENLGLFLAECFSTACPNGETGHHNINHVEEISPQEFADALNAFAPDTHGEHSP